MGVEHLLEETRLLARALESWRATRQDDDSIRGAMRGVLDRLSSSGPSTVPTIARAEGVSRQTIQVQVDTLSELGMVERRANPAHRRSTLIALTDAGRAWVEDTRAREEHALARLQVGVSDTAVTDATRVLAAWRDALTIVHSGD
jgi:DNA-binding MarR family transcriptional regulator